MINGIKSYNDKINIEYTNISTSEKYFPLTRMIINHTSTDGATIKIKLAKSIYPTILILSQFSTEKVYCICLTYENNVSKYKFIGSNTLEISTDNSTNEFTITKSSARMAGMIFFMHPETFISIT